MLPLFTDTKCGRQSGFSSWEVMDKLFEDEKPQKVQRKVIVDISNSLEPNTEEAANYFMH